MSWITTIEQIGKDVELGLQAAGAVIESISPALGTVLTEVATVIGAIETAIEGGAAVPPASAISTVVQAATVTSVLKSAK